MWISHCGGFSHCRAQAVGCVGSVVAVPGLQSTGSVVVVNGAELHCACGGLPGPGRNSVYPALEGGFFATEPPGKSPFVYFCLYLYCLRRLT